MRLTTIKRRMRAAALTGYQVLRLHRLMYGVPDDDTLVGNCANRRWSDAIGVVVADDMSERRFVLRYGPRALLP